MALIGAARQGAVDHDPPVMVGVCGSEFLRLRSRHEFLLVARPLRLFPYEIAVAGKLRTPKPDGDDPIVWEDKASAGGEAYGDQSSLNLARRMLPITDDTSPSTVSAACPS